MKLVQGESLLDRIRNAGEARLDPEALAESLEILNQGLRRRPRTPTAAASSTAI